VVRSWLAHAGFIGTGLECTPFFRFLFRADEVACQWVEVLTLTYGGLIYSDRLHLSVLEKPWANGGKLASKARGFDLFDGSVELDVGGVDNVWRFSDSREYDLRKDGAGTSPRCNQRGRDLWARRPGCKWSNQTLWTSWSLSNQ